MQRKQDESFEDYKARRAVSNHEVRMLKNQAKGGKVGSRERLRDARAAARSRGIGVTRAASTRRRAGAAHATFQALH